mmetsp:Transcript_21879/g.43416  ORF Transcript_21879/g.43416 Transcript_21879/m.43416 type:complete len:226 (+) Transcript_21879:24-701(+)
MIFNRPGKDKDRQYHYQNDTRKSPQRSSIFDLKAISNNQGIDLLTGKRVDDSDTGRQNMRLQLLARKMSVLEGTAASETKLMPKEDPVTAADIILSQLVRCSRNLKRLAKRSAKCDFFDHDEDIAVEQNNIAVLLQLVRASCEKVVLSMRLHKDFISPTTEKGIESIKRAARNMSKLGAKAESGVSVDELTRRITIVRANLDAAIDVLEEGIADLLVNLVNVDDE